MAKNTEQGRQMFFHILAKAESKLSAGENINDVASWLAKRLPRR